MLSYLFKTCLFFRFSIKNKKGKKKLNLAHTHHTHAHIHALKISVNMKASSLNVWEGCFFEFKFPCACVDLMTLLQSQIFMRFINTSKSRFLNLNSWLVFIRIQKNCTFLIFQSLHPGFYCFLSVSLSLICLFAHYRHGRQTAWLLFCTVR